MNRQIIRTSAIVGISLLMPIIAFAQWTSAPANPPSSNTAAPINVSNNNQAKVGGLEVGSFLSDGGAVVMGNLGVGLVPTRKLEVAGSIYSSGGDFTFADAGVIDATAVRLFSAAGYLFLQSGAGGDTIFRNKATSEQMRILNNGDVGIGKPNPGYKLDVSGDVNGTRLCIAGTCMSAWPTGGSGTVTSVSAGSNISVTGTAAAPVVNVVSSPTFTNVTASAYYYSSDRNLKKNIVNLDSGVSLQNILSLQGVSFDWKDTGKHSAGLIAQDIEKVYPELVATDPKTGLKSVEYGNLVAPLIEAVKAQQKEIDILKAEVAALKAK